MPRLLHAVTRQFQEFIGGSVPRYAILSHTWADKELTFKDVQDRQPSDYFPRDPKIDGCCTRALKDGYEWVWIDTICIDKSSSAELSEAINSMFDWYYRSDVCYAYLSDVPPSEDPLDPSSSFWKSRWFTRGWTLQELLAPSIVRFFDREWDCIGEKDSRMVGGDHIKQNQDENLRFGEAVAEITRIPAKILLSPDARFDRFGGQTITEKMSWASKRRVTRQEDEAYSLLGLFQINMPLLYGEGSRAFQRLQQELIKVSDDETLFAWGLMPAYNWVEASTRTRLLALSVSDFELPEGVSMIRHHGLTEVHGFRADHYLVTNKGVLFRKPVQSASCGDISIHLIPLMCSLWEISPGPLPRRSSMLALLVESDRADPSKYYRVCEQPISVPRELFRSSRAPMKEIYVSGEHHGRSAIAARIFHIIRPVTLNKADADGGIRLSSFYPPEMQVINRFGENTLLVHRHESARSRQYERRLWAAWQDTLRPGMRRRVYFISFNGTLGSFVVMIFYGEPGDDHLPFKRDELKADGSVPEGAPTQQEGKPAVPQTSRDPITRTWQFRVARLTPPRTSLKERLIRLAMGKTPQPSARLYNILEALVDVRKLPWAEELPCAPLGTLKFKVMEKASEAWTLAMEFEMDEKSSVMNPGLDAIFANPFFLWKANRFRTKVAEIGGDAESVMGTRTTVYSSTDSDADSMGRGGSW